MKKETTDAIDLAEQRLKEVVEAAREGLDNLDNLRNEGREDRPFEQTIDYLRGDAYELEQRTGRATQDIEAVVDLAEDEAADDEDEAEAA